MATAGPVSCRAPVLLLLLLLVRHKHIRLGINAAGRGGRLQRRVAASVTSGRKLPPTNQCGAHSARSLQALELRLCALL